MRHQIGGLATLGVGVLAGALATGALIELWVLGFMAVLAFAFFAVRGWPSRVDWSSRGPFLVDGVLLGVGTVTLAFGMTEASESSSAPWLAVGSTLTVAALVGAFLLRLRRHGAPPRLSSSHSGSSGERG
jgi:hypothetical protein